MLHTPKPRFPPSRARRGSRRPTDHAHEHSSIEAFQLARDIFEVRHGKEEAKHQYVLVGSHEEEAGPSIRKEHPDDLEVHLVALSGGGLEHVGRHHSSYEHRESYQSRAILPFIGLLARVDWGPCVQEIDDGHALVMLAERLHAQ